MRSSLLAPLTLAACLDTSLPPLAEARFYVDTDLPVGLVDRLRVDVYSADGKRWLATNDVPMLSATSWPATFGVYDPDAASARAVLVRLRLYRGGVVRDYHGERFLPRPSTEDPSFIPSAPIPEGEGPRLILEGNDRTPRLEPKPSAAVDRLVRLRLTRDRSGYLDVILRGACAGTMANLETLETCVDTENERGSPDVPLADEPITVSAQGTFGRQPPCAIAPNPGTTNAAGVPLHDEEICIQGRPFLFGGRLTVSAAETSAQPERIVVEPSFLIDKHEVTVLRFREAWKRAEVTLLPVANDGPLVGRDDGMAHACTFSFAERVRDEYPVNCVSFAAARAFCEAQGKEMLSETQFELAATLDYAHARYPWGDEDPSCDRAIYQRDRAGVYDCAPKVSESGVQRVDHPASDVAPTGVVNLGGSLSEMMSDDFRSLSSACWSGQSALSPRCDDPSAEHSVRAGSWISLGRVLRVERREKVARDFIGPSLGFRCARKAG